MNERDEESVEGTDQSTDQKTEDNRKPDRQLPCHNEHTGKSTDERDYGTDGQIDVTTGKNTEQHTCCENSDISILSDKVRDVRRSEEM